MGVLDDPGLLAEMVTVDDPGLLSVTMVIATLIGTTGDSAKAEDENTPRELKVDKIKPRVREITILLWILDIFIFNSCSLTI